MTTAVFCPIQQQFYPSYDEYSDAEAAVLNAVDDLDLIDELPGWEEDGDITTVADALKDIQSVLDEHWTVLSGLDLNYQKLTERIRRELSAIEITEVDADGRIVVVGYCNPYLSQSLDSEDEEF